MNISIFYHFFFCFDAMLSVNESILILDYNINRIQVTNSVASPFFQHIHEQILNIEFVH